MKKFTKRITVAVLCAALACVACFGLSACGGEGGGEDGALKTMTPGTLSVITNAEYEPFEYMDGDQIVGFDAALINAIGDKLGLQVDIKNQAFDTLVTAIAGGSTADCAISAITISDERAKDVDFTNSYYDSNLAIVALKDGELQPSDDLNAVKEALTGKKIGAQSGTTGESWAKENLKDIDYTPFQETPDLLGSLRTHSLDAAIYDSPVAEAHVNGEYTDCQILNIIPTGEQYGIIVNKDNPELTEAINGALEELQADGTIDQLLSEYF